MRNIHGEKVKDIIRKEFDSRMEMAVIGYILDNGFEDLAQITEEEILEVKGNAMMTDKFCQALVRTAVMICKECNKYDEFLPFIVNHLYVPNAKMQEITIYKEECKEWVWEELLRTYDLEDDEENIYSITLNANVMNTTSYKRLGE